MKAKCETCGMIRSKKDLVKIESNYFICFHCWNEYLKGNLQIKEIEKYNKN
ncbi:MAG: hypothetical protein ACTSUX_06575 [Promethearchaeota archaeon]